MRISAHTEKAEHTVSPVSSALGAWDYIAVCVCSKRVAEKAGDERSVAAQREEHKQ